MTKVLVYKTEIKEEELDIEFPIYVKMIKGYDTKNETCTYLKVLADGKMYGITQTSDDYWNSVKNHAFMIGQTLLQTELPLMLKPDTNKSEYSSSCREEFEEAHLKAQICLKNQGWLL